MGDQRIYRRRVQQPVKRRRWAKFERLEARVVLCSSADILFPSPTILNESADPTSFELDPNAGNPDRAPCILAAGLGNDAPAALVNRLSLARDLTAAPGDTVVVPVRISTADLPASGRLAGVGLALEYDKNLLVATSVAPGGLIADNPGWTMVDNIRTPGRVVVVAFTSRPVGGVTNDVFANLTFVVNGAAPAGPTRLNVVASFSGAFTELLDEDDNLLELAGPVTNGEDPIDGVITIGGGVPTVNLGVDNPKIDEAGGAATVTATLSAAASSDVIIDLGLSGTATSGVDYAASANQIVIAAGDTSGSAIFIAVDDGDDEGDETIIVDVVGVAGALENGEQQVTATILDDDGPVVVNNRLSIARDLTAAPGDTVVVPVDISTADLPASGRLAGVVVALEYDKNVLVATSVAPGGLITGNPDWTMIDNFRTPGRVVVVAFTSRPVGGVTNDSFFNVTFVVNGAAPAGPTSLNVVASSGGAFTELLDEDDNLLELAGPVTNGEDPIDGVITIGGGIPTVSLGVDHPEIAESGGAATITATLSAAADSDVTIDLGFSGTATSGIDYAATSNQIRIAAGDTSGSAIFIAVDDGDDEGDETIVVEVTGVTGAREDGEQQVTATILDDDGPAVVSNRLSIPRDLTAAPGDTVVVPVHITTADLPAGGRLAGVGLALIYDKDVLVATSVSPGGLATGNPGWTMVDNLSTPGRLVVVSFTSNPVGGVTNDVLANVTFVVNGAAPAGPTSLNVVASSGGAFTELLDENDNLLDLAGPVTNGEDPIDGVITIGSGVPTVSLAVDNLEIAEAGGAATITATLSAAADSDVTIDLGLSGTASSGTDYTLSSSRIVIPAGATSDSATVTAIQDAEVDADESIIIDITNVINANEAGEQQVTIMIADDESMNQPPVLNDPGTLKIPETRRRLDVTLVATDPDLSDSLTYAAEVESAEYFLDQTLDLNLHVELFEDFGGLGEKWVLGGDNLTWYYITPDGDFYEWYGGSVLNREFIATLSPTTYADPSLLYDAQPGNRAPVEATLNENVLTLAPEAGFVGAFSVTAVVSDGEQADSKFFLVVLEPNESPTLDDPGPQTLPTTRPTLDVVVNSTDPMNDPLTLSATVETGEYYLDQTIGLQLGPEGLFPNWSGTEDERWVLSDDGNQWYFITPDGNFYRWSGGDRNIAANRELIATLSPETHANPSLLYDAQAGGAVPAVVSVNGSTLTIDPSAGFVGTFSVLVTVTDLGGASDSRLVRVDVMPAAAVERSVPLNWNDERGSTAANQADRVMGGSESSFANQPISASILDERDGVRLNDRSSDAQDAAVDELLEKDLMLLDDFADNLGLVRKGCLP